MNELSDHTSGIEPNVRSGDSRVLAVGSIAAVLASSGASLLAYGQLPSEVQIHWTFGAGPYYGPETIPTALALALFPMLVAGIALGGVWLAARLRAVDEFADIRALHTAAVLGTLVVVLGSQAAIFLANL